VVSPLWFLLPYLALSAVTRPLARVVDRTGPAVALAGVPVVVLSDLGLVPGWTAIPAAWSVPWILGVALARGRLRGGPAVLVTGVTGMIVLIGVLGYPASAVGVPGQGRSNLDPPSLVAISLATAQIGGFLMVRGRLSRGSRVIAAVNRRALPIYLGHQSVLVLVTVAAALSGWLAPGLLTAPDGPGWAAHRVVWLPVFAAVLAAVVGIHATLESVRRHVGVPAHINSRLRGTLLYGSPPEDRLGPDDLVGGDRCAR
jgi:hypothetical protein